jgi:hypothetical protein
LAGEENCEVIPFHQTYNFMLRRKQMMNLWLLAKQGNHGGIASA